MTCTNVILAQPQAGATVDYTIPEGDSARLSFGPEDISGIRINDTGALVISFADGGQVNIANFQSMVDNGNLVYLADGTLVDPKLLQSGLASGLTRDTANDNDIVIAIPSEGVVREITLEPSQNYIFAFDMTAPKKAETVDGKFVMSFDNGSQIVLTNYEQAMSASIPPSIAMESKICTFTNKELVTAITDLTNPVVVQKEEEEEIVQAKTPRKVTVAEDVANIEPAAGEPAAEQLAQIEPAAGDEQGNSGYGFNSTPGSDPFAGIDDIGPINPTALGYNAPTFEQKSFIPAPVGPLNSVPNPGTFITSVDETNLVGGNLVTTGTVVVNFGADGPSQTVPPFQPNGNLTVGCSVAGGVLAVQGNPVTITPTANGYEGHANGVLVFTFTINPSTGQYTYTQIEAFDHADATNPNDAICLTFPILVTDRDGDTATTTITVYVYDDAPDAVNDTFDVVEGQVITDNVVTRNDTVSQDSPTLITNVRFGTTDYPIPADGTNVVIVGQFGTLTINNTGAFTYQTNTNNPDGTDVFTYTLVDFDGDSDTADLIIRVTALDDVPEVVNPPVQEVDESFLGPIVRDGTITADFGGDGPGTFAGTNNFTFSGSALNGGLSHNGNPVVVSYNEATGTYTGVANGTTVFTLLIREDGTYTFTLLENLDHADGNDPNDVIRLNFGFEAEDADGDTTPGVIRIDVLDDAPVIASSQRTVDETDLGPVAVNGDLNIDFGEDGPAAINPVSGNGNFASSGSRLNDTLTSNGQPVAVGFNPANDTYTGTAGGQTVFTLVIHDNGTYTFTLFKPLDHADQNDPNDIINLDFGVVATDYDGDKSANTIRIRVLDDVPTIGDSEGAVDETNFDQGNLVYSDILDHNFGLELGSITPNGAATFSTPLLSSGQPVTVTQTANGYTATAGGQTVFTLTINPATGAYTYTQFRDLDHPDTNDHNDVITITFPVTVTSTDGDSDTGSIVIKVYDDGPTANDDINGAEEGQVITGNVTDNDDLSQDDPNTIINVNFNGTNHPVAAVGNTTIVTPLGTLVINAAGQYTFTAASNDPNGTAVFTYTLRDDDGDTDTATLSIRVTPDGAPVAVDQSLAVDETNLTPGPMIFNGDLNVDFGADGQGATGGVAPIANSFAYTGSVLGGTLTSSGSPVSVTLSGNTFTGTAADGRQIFTLQINPNGTYSFQLFDHIDHADGTNPNDMIKLTFGVSVTDADGDTANGKITIDVYDDAPVAYDDGRTVVESATVTGNVTDNDELSEDNPNFVVNVRFNGVDHPLPNTNADITIVGQYGTLTINRTGQYSYTANSNNPDGVDRFTYSLRDFDGDVDTAELSFTVSKINDIPIVVNAVDLVDETNLQFNTPIVETGSITVNYGGDGPGVVGGTGTFDSSGFRVNNILSSNGVPVNVTFDAATNTYTGAAGGTTVFSLVIQPNGDYTFRLYGNLDHSDPTNDNEPIYLTFGIKGTDADGDVGTGTLTVTVLDDVPVIGNNAVTVDETSFGTSPTLTASGTVNYSFGQDGIGSVTANGGFSSTDPTLTSNGVAIDVNRVGNNYEGRANGVLIFTLAITPGTGAYTYTQFEQIDHPDSNNPDDVVTLSFGVRVTEGDGDTADGFIRVNVRDDGPDAVDDVRTGSTGGQVLNGNVMSNDKVGADDPGTITNVRFNGTNHTVPAGGSTTINGTYGTLIINSNGTYTYTTRTGTASGTDVFSYTLRDFDGDTDTANLSIFVEYDAQPIVANAVETVDESFLNITETGTVNVNYGGDGPGTITGNGSFSSDGSKLGGNLTHNGVPVNVTFDAATGTYTGTAGATTVFTLQINTNGSYTYRQFDNLDHANGSDANDVITLNFGVTATDSDGDTGNGLIVINVRDDAPVAVNDNAGVREAGQTATGNILTNDRFGADDGANARLVNVTFGGQTVAIPANGWTDWINITTVMWGVNMTTAQLRVHSNGSYELRGNVEGTYQAQYTIRDHDGDTASATLTAQFVAPAPPTWGDGGGGDGGGDGCPLAFDLNGNGLTLISKEDSGILFDIDEDGIADRTAWVGADDAILVWDKNGDGIINDHSEMFGNNEMGGYQVLSMFDSNNDGVIDANDEIWSKLQLWQDLNQDGISTPDEMFTLDQVGFLSINLAVKQIAEIIAGNHVTTQGEVTMADGSTIYGYDAWFKYDSGADKNFVEVDGRIKNLIEAFDDDIIQTAEGADHILFNAIQDGIVHQIEGFNAAEGDSLDFSYILDGQDDVTDAIHAFVYAREENGSTILSVDVSGSGDIANAVDVARLSDVVDLDVTEMLENRTIVL